MPTFDIDAARKSGASDDEILTYLSQRAPKFDVQGALKSGASKQDVISYLAVNSEPPAAVTSSVSNAPKFPSKAWFKSQAYNVADKFTESLPAAGATAGAIIGGTAGTGGAPGPGTALGAVGGAGIGGMGGEALRQISRRALGFEAPTTSAEAAKEITKQGIVQGAIQGATEGAGRFLPGPLKAAAVKQYTKALSPTTIENKVIAKDIAPEMIDRGIRGSTEAIQEQAGKEINALRPRVEAAYRGVPVSKTATQSPISNTLNSLEAMKAKYTVDGEIVNPSAVNAIESVQQIIEKHGNGISPQSLRKIKQIFDEAVSEAGGYTTADLSTNYSLKAQKVAANKIRDVLHTAGPDAAMADKEISFWLDVNQVARATNLRRAGQEGGLLKTFTPLAYGAAAGAAGLTHGAEAGLGAGSVTALAGFVAQAMRTPTWRTSSAIIKDRLAEALLRGDVRMSAALLGRLGVTIPATLTKQSQQNRSAESLQSSQPQQ